MKIFLDANILVSVLNREYPVFPVTARLLSLADDDRFQLYTSPVCLAIAFYFAEKKSGAPSAKKRIGLLLDKIGLALHGKDHFLKIIDDKRIFDVEDGMEYFAARDVGCEYIVTMDIGDFHYSEIPVVGPADMASIINSYLVEGNYA